MTAVQDELLPAPTAPHIASAPEVMDAYWRFAATRHDLYLRRVRGDSTPSADPVLSRYRFTNAYRACDRVSQYLIREVQYKHDQAPHEVVLRTLLFKMFNKVETWATLCAQGVPNTGTFDPDKAADVLQDVRATGATVYSAAYIVPPVSLCRTPKHRGHLRLVAMMLDDGLPDLASACGSLDELYRLLKRYPGIGDFLAFQLAIDLNYSDAVDLDEADFVVAGPGALDGLSKCMPEVRPADAALAIHSLADRQEEEFERRGIVFPGLFGRRLQPVDMQNLLCEISKYSRVAFPGVAGRAGRTRIKQRYAAAGPLPPPFFPPKWGLDPRPGSPAPD